MNPSSSPFATMQMQPACAAANSLHHDCHLSAAADSAPASHAAFSTMACPCNKRHCALASLPLATLGSSAYRACKANRPHRYVAIAYSSHDGVPFCISCSDSLEENRLAGIKDRRRILILQWSEEEGIYTA